MAEQSIRTSFVSETYKTSVGEGLTGLSEYGYVPDGDPVPLEYLCRITSIRNAATVVAPLQENITLHVESYWGPAVPTSVFDLANKVFQFASQGRMSAITRASSRRIWMGSRPVVIAMRLSFQAVKDPFREVVEPTRLLQCIALPRGPRSADEAGEEGWIGGAQKVVPFLAPPGPTPFTTEGILNLRGVNESRVAQYIEGLKGGDKIMVEIGRFLTFPNVVVVAATPVIPIAFGPDGNPIRSEVAITFETYEMMTVEDLNGVYRKTDASLGSSEGLEQ